MLCNILQQYDYLKLSTRIVIKKKKNPLHLLAGYEWGRSHPTQNCMQATNMSLRIKYFLPRKRVPFRPLPPPWNATVSASL